VWITMLFVLDRASLTVWMEQGTEGEVASCFLLICFDMWACT